MNSTIRDVASSATHLPRDVGRATDGGGFGAGDRFSRASRVMGATFAVLAVLESAGIGAFLIAHGKVAEGIVVAVGPPGIIGSLWYYDRRLRASAAAARTRIPG